MHLNLYNQQCAIKDNFPAQILFTIKSVFKTSETSPSMEHPAQGAAGDRRGTLTPACAGFHQPTSDSMAAMPSSGLLMATCDYHLHRPGSPSSNSSCRSAEYAGEAIPHHPRADPHHWWASFFFGKSTLPFMATMLESPEHSESPQASSSTIICDLALEARRKQLGDQPGKADTRPPS
ncbi:pancreatic progenitor cell differentiation and proliferation factor-like [Zalophus californianus]|uniref:Pancreatic progenitor cell differentiation and proliferation factor-like n=1 Tax=Zalophus californianus TaxID=9704 RepID=A0A6P9FEP7_ZALCA|nr:pancreatic progenitor cell differentiation and proliferation factor-like [Zalophus californianus]